MVTWRKEMHQVVTRAVACPFCGENASVALPDEETDVRVRKSVAAFGECTTVTCSQGDTYWVYFC
ncbi:hypothetical protein [Natrinema gelatinilyticum]|uniref:hypothetical protein n=1 Tax=Natrinema gelatinilyticum TaxID=2961571 RepID=UPI0020C46C37|nr:hypothetical protein [Natrinema gelatinilyticum]